MQETTKSKNKFAFVFLLQTIITWFGFLGLLIYPTIKYKRLREFFLPAIILLVAFILAITHYILSKRYFYAAIYYSGI